jgi:hypothetical protein
VITGGCTTTTGDKSARDRTSAGVESAGDEALQVIVSPPEVTLAAIFPIAANTLLVARVFDCASPGVACLQAVTAWTSRAVTPCQSVPVDLRR